ncbi:MAG: hypothetical protein JWL89_242 [Candidatus Saccharibacteria bacterium]|nr:hypothetical protein [Candidatus Saccharibacteria bacterium]
MYPEVEIETVMMIVDDQNEVVKAERADTQLTPDQQLEYDAQIERAVKVFKDTIRVREVVRADRDTMSHTKVYEGVDMGEYWYEDGDLQEGRWAHVYAQPTEHLFHDNGRRQCDINFSVPKLETDLSDGVPYLHSGNAHVLRSLSIATVEDRRISKLEQARKFNQFLYQIATKVGITSQ